MAMPEPNYNTFCGPVALIPPAILNGSWQTYQPKDDAPLAGKIAWQLAPGIITATLEVEDQRIAQGGKTSAPQRYLYGLPVGTAPGTKGTQGHPIHLGPYQIGDAIYTSYMVFLTTKIRYTDQWGNEQTANGLDYAAFIVS